jgi:hypothetical protein
MVFPCTCSVRKFCYSTERLYAGQKSPASPGCNPAFPYIAKAGFGLVHRPYRYSEFSVPPDIASWRNSGRDRSFPGHWNTPGQSVPHHLRPVAKRPSGLNAGLLPGTRTAPAGFFTVLPPELLEFSQQKAHIDRLILG